MLVGFSHAAHFTNSRQSEHRGELSCERSGNVTLYIARSCRRFAEITFFFTHSLSAWCARKQYVTMTTRFSVVAPSASKDSGSSEGLL